MVPRLYGDFDKNSLMFWKFCDIQHSDISFSLLNFRKQVQTKFFQTDEKTIWNDFSIVL